MRRAPAIGLLSIEHMIKADTFTVMKFCSEKLSCSSFCGALATDDKFEMIFDNFSHSLEECRKCTDQFAYKIG